MITEQISYGNKALQFIDKRIADDHYRGSKSSQHNRYTMEKIHTILTLLNDYAPAKSLMRIRDTDISKRPENTPEEYRYAEFCEQAKVKCGIGTQDAMRKNLFVDLHRMGFIERFGEDQKATDPYGGSSIKYVALTDEGLRFVRASNVLDRYFMFSKALDKLLGGYIGILLDLLGDVQADLGVISEYEFMLFVSAIDTNTPFRLTQDECIALIKSYRQLSNVQRAAVINTLKAKMNPKGIVGSKTAKRDFHNWHNKTAQVFYLLKQAVYFEIRGDKLMLSNKQAPIHASVQQKRLDRSLDEKYQYFRHHNVGKTTGFELHHVVPLSWSESIHQFKLFDKWENMVYIDAYSHAKITQNRNRNVNMEIDGDNLELCDFVSNKVYLEKDKNIVYDPELKDTMLGYNQELLKTA